MIPFLLWKHLLTWETQTLEELIHGSWNLVGYQLFYKFIWRNSWILGHFFIQQCTFYFIFPYFWLYHGACGILVTWSGIDPHLQQLKLRVLNIGPPGNSLLVTFKATIFLKQWEESKKNVIWSYSLLWCIVGVGGCMHTCPMAEVGWVLCFKTIKKRFLCLNKLRTTAMGVMFYRACFTKLNEIFKS